ncbi:hypothetical protein K493DRAFT_51725 [Basidiobolus meristosporus CBS 931.73]|uniref:DNA helicase Pif1-like 2B domain-containing protein n=1 Tax=Basidiobolus meristosporus CBS 931.73 TaxID=1314790 RepID=A0A1Y1XZZ6_9FUNG|nr:hypothetical protein K493DRAFT_51725 [Basidiobolus meristosporus CBS 931.73]|eukprot:ORX91317.1 hypothetical protein K493DRAFT_51725 [Basidiobolus meristosporus CBS 931.73]
MANSPCRYSLRGEVDAANAQKLDSLPGDVHRYVANDKGKSPFLERLSANSLAPSTLELKLHAQVLLIRNIDYRLVNGSLGVVVGFEEDTGMPIVRFTGCTITVRPETWKMEVPGLGEVASRTQVGYKGYKPSSHLKT